MTPSADRQRPTKVTTMAQDYFGQDLDLETLLQGTIEEYEQKRVAAWKEDEDGTRYLAFFDALAKWMLSSTEELTVTDEESGVEWDAALSLLDVADIVDEVKEKVQIDIAWEFATGTDKMTDRCLQLTRDVLRHRPSKRVLRFLGRPRPRHWPPCNTSWPC